MILLTQRLVKIFAYICLLTVFCCCSPGQKSTVPHQLTATVTKSIPLPEIPSGSAIEQYDGSWLIITDDALHFYRIYADGTPLDSIRLAHVPGMAARRIPKPVKPDYEAAISATISGEVCLVAFGSGSLRPQRDSAIIIKLADKSQQLISLADLYSAMRAQAGLTEADFNIEAAALHGNTLLLINRGTNHVFCMDWTEALAYLISKTATPKIKSSVLSLPKRDSFNAGISGACFLDARHVLFCASVEATADWIADGEVLGSYIGIIGLDDKGVANLISIAPVHGINGQPVTDKIEGIGMPDREKQTVLAIVDNDDGSSQLLTIRLTNILSSLRQ